MQTNIPVWVPSRRYHIPEQLCHQTPTGELGAFQEAAEPSKHPGPVFGGTQGLHLSLPKGNKYLMEVFSPDVKLVSKAKWNPEA